ncbi:MAG: hypothetical protein ACRC6I_17375 [Paracoccaceae bacterium]
MQPSQKIEVIHPTMRTASLRSRITLTNGLTIGAAFLAIVLSVTLSFAGNTDTCARPLDLTVSAPCHYR